MKDENAKEIVYRDETCFGPDQVATMMKTTLWRNFQVGRLSSSKSGRQKTEMLPQFYRGEDGLTKTDSSVRNMSRFSLLPTDFMPPRKAAGDRTG